MLNYFYNMVALCAVCYGVQTRHGKWSFKELFALPYYFVYPLFKCLNCFSVTNVKTFSGKDFSTLAQNVSLFLRADTDAWTI